MRPWKKSRTDSTAHGIAPTWMGTCSACATSRALASQSAVEKSRLEFRICEYAVRSIASPISWTIASKRCCRTETVIGSSIVRTVYSERVVLASAHAASRGAGARRVPRRVRSSRIRGPARPYAAAQAAPQTRDDGQAGGGTRQVDPDRLGARHDPRLSGPGPTRHARAARHARGGPRRRLERAPRPRPATRPRRGPRPPDPGRADGGPADAQGPQGAVSGRRRDQPLRRPAQRRNGAGRALAP